MPNAKLASGVVESKGHHLSIQLEQNFMIV